MKHYQGELAGDNRTKGGKKAVASRMKNMPYIMKTDSTERQSASYNLLILSSQKLNLMWLKEKRSLFNSKWNEVIY